MKDDLTYTRLIDMKMPSMANELLHQLSEPAMEELSFEQRVGMMVDAEWLQKQLNRSKRLLRLAHLPQENATIEGIEYISGRDLDRKLITRLSECEYIDAHHNVVILGATGSGKTYVACALGKAAIQKSYPVKYVRLPELLTDLSIARGDGSIRKALDQYKKPSLLIIDDWLLFQPTDLQAMDLLEITEARCGRASTIYCSQFDTLGWIDRIGGSIQAESVCDRIVHDAYYIRIDSKESMRKYLSMKQGE